MTSTAQHAQNWIDAQMAAAEQAALANEPFDDDGEKFSEDFGAAGPASLNDPKRFERPNAPITCMLHPSAGGMQSTYCKGGSVYRDMWGPFVELSARDFAQLVMMSFPF
jgi:hypothetical protein